MHRLLRAIRQASTVGTLAAGLLGAPGLHAQDARGARTLACAVTDSAAARQAGREAARRPIVAGYAAAAFVAGVPMGFMAPLAFGESGFGPGDPETRIVALGAAGLGATAAVAARRATLPTRDAAQVGDCTPEYRAVFGDAYAAHLRQRRLRATVWGGAAGGVTGAALLLWLATQLTT